LRTRPLSRSEFSGPVLWPKPPTRSKSWRARNRWPSQANLHQSIDECSPLLHPKVPQLDQPFPGLPERKEIAESSEQAVNSEPGTGTGIPAAIMVQSAGREPSIQEVKTSQDRHLNQPTTHSTPSTEGVATTCVELPLQEPSALENKGQAKEVIGEENKVKATCTQHCDEVNDHTVTTEGLSRYF
jgi:hypothetical protein